MTRHNPEIEKLIEGIADTNPMYSTFEAPKYRCKTHGEHGTVIFLHAADQPKYHGKGYCLLCVADLVTEVEVVR